MNIKQTDEHIKLTLDDYIGTIIKDLNYGTAHLVSVPMEPGFDLSLDPNVTCDGFRYRSIIGKLMFASSTVRVDISQAVSLLARKLKDQTEMCLNATFRMVKYLKGTQSHGLVFKKGRQNDSIELSIYSDASFADNKEDRKSTSGFVTLLNGTAVTWKSTKQKIVALSSTEAEHIALTESVKEAKWLSHLLDKLDVNISRPIKVLEDNESAIKLSNHSMFHSRTKHIDIRYHFVREEVHAGLINLVSRGTKDMFADCLTKPLAGAQFVKLRKLAGLY